MERDKNKRKCAHLEKYSFLGMRNKETNFNTDFFCINITFY